LLALKFSVLYELQTNGLHLFQFVLFGLVWMVVSFFKKHRLSTTHGTGPSYATLSAMEAPEPYQRMEQERLELINSPRFKSPRGPAVFDIIACVYQDIRDC
jgi:hypothetical protein